MSRLPSPSPVVYQIVWRQTSSDGHAAPLERTYRRSLDMSWIPEAGERVHLSESGAASVLVDSLAWMVDGRPLVILMPWESQDVPPWSGTSGFVELSDA